MLQQNVFSITAARFDTDMGSCIIKSIRLKRKAQPKSVGA
nr:MAG TPA: hypothetical protein [Caudoviricetes sp.]